MLVMNHRNWSRLVSAQLLTALLSLAACTSTSLVDVWVDESRAGGSFEKLLVVAITQSDRDRRIFEDRLVAEIRARGCEAVPSYTLLPAGSEVGREGLSEAARKGGFDAVLVTHYAGSEETTVYVPGRTRTDVYGGPPRAGRVDDHYWRTWETVQEPGYYEKLETIHLETNVYEVAAEKLVWSARSETMNPASTQDLIEDLSRKVAASLASNGLL